MCIRTVLQLGARTAFKFTTKIHFSNECPPACVYCVILGLFKMASIAALQTLNVHLKQIKPEFRDYFNLLITQIVH